MFIHLAPRRQHLSIKYPRLKPTINQPNTKLIVSSLPFLTFFTERTQQTTQNAKENAGLSRNVSPRSLHSQAPCLPLHEAHTSPHHTRHTSWTSCIGGVQNGSAPTQQLNQNQLELAFSAVFAESNIAAATTVRGEYFN